MMKGLALRGRSVTLALTLVGLIAAPVWAQSVKIAFVDVQKVMVESVRGKEVLSKLQAEKEAKQKEIEAKEAEIRKMEAELEKQGSVLSEPARREREEAIRKKIRDLRRTVEDVNRDLAQRQRDLESQLAKDIAAIIRSYGKEHGYLLIVERGAAGVIYGGDQADLTAAILAAYNASQAKEKKK
jgi:outer membrane protein